MSDAKRHPAGPSGRSWRTWLGTCLALSMLPHPASALTRENRMLLRLMDEVCVANNGTPDAAAQRALAIGHGATDIGMRPGPAYQRAVSMPDPSSVLVLVAAPTQRASFTECRISGRTHHLGELLAAACAKWPLGPLRGTPAGTHAFAVTITAGRRMLALRLTGTDGSGGRPGSFVFEAVQVH